LLLDGLAWGVEPLALMESLAAFPAHAPVADRLTGLLRAGTPLPEALTQLGAPVALIEAARLGKQLNAHAAAGLRARVADDGRREARLTVLNGLALPLLTLLIASAVIASSARVWADLPGVTLPAWVPWTAWGLLAASLLAIGAVMVPRFGALLRRLPGLGWIGARRRAARWADLLALTGRRNGSLPDALTALGAPGLARRISAGTALPDALRHHPTGRQLAPGLRSVPPAQWPRALEDQARRLVAAADRRAWQWAIGLRTGGTLAAAIVVGAWLIAIYGNLGTLPEQGAP
jgi:hypothetical protein